MSSFDHLKLPLKDIKTATNNFAHENLIRRGGFGKIYKGELSRSGELINIVARRLDSRFGQGTKEFETQIMLLSSLKHQNIASIIGFCDENNEKIIINKFEANGSLDLYLSDPTLTWTQRLQICLGVARPLSYIHHDEGHSFSVIHRNIKSSKILLDDKWEAKLSGFGLSIMQPAAQRHSLVLDHACGTHGYLDPAYLKSESVSHKSDVYSFGVILFEVMCRREGVNQKKLQLLANLVAKSDDQKDRNVNDIIHPGLRIQMNSKSLKIFSKAAYCCLKKQRSQRPNIDAVIVALEEALKCQRAHVDSLQLGTESPISPATYHYWKTKKLKHLEIGLDAIKLATENFSEKYLIRSGVYGAVYKGELEHFDSYSISDAKRPSRRRSTVAIKYIFKTHDIEVFFAEIITLSTCMHPNIVSLLGFCAKHPHMIIVYERLSNGSLADYLKGLGTKTKLTWVQRLKICIDIACGLHYLHTSLDHKQKIIHRDIRSSNILLGENLEAKISEFGLSKFDHIWDRMNSTKVVASTPYYLDPEYERTGKLRIESDVYSFGVVLFEILTGKLAYDPVYTNESKNGLATIVRAHFEKGTIKELLDPKLEEESASTQNKGLNQDSLNTFLTIGHRCLAEKQAERPTMKVIIEELEKALKFQVKNLDHLRIGIEAIMLATDNFSLDHVIGSGAYGQVYKAKLSHFDSNGIRDDKELKLHMTCSTVAIKRILNGEDTQGEEGFFTEIETLSNSKHANVVSLLGFCYEPPHMILVYEYVPNGSIDDYLSNNEKMTNLTWEKRIKICIDIACGLHYLHTTTEEKQKIIHRDIKSANILLGENLEAKIADFGLSKFQPVDHKASTINTNIIAGTQVYLDPEYQSTGKLKKESDVYSFGVVLFEILSGRLAYDPIYTNENEKGLAPIVRQHFEKGTIKEILDPNLKDEGTFTLSKEPNQDSFNTFTHLGYRCLSLKQTDRPTMEVVIEKLRKALKFQETHKDGLRISFEDIRSGTQAFSNQIGQGRLGKIYKGEILRANGPTPIAVKRYDDCNGQGEKEFLAEVEVLFEYRHENIICLVGYCNENNEKILVYEYAYNSSLDKHLKDASLTWADRLKIGIEVASALKFLHGGSNPLIHGNIKSANVLLTEDWKVKISDFGSSIITPIYNEIDFVTKDAWSIPDQRLAQHASSTKQTDIYSLGVLLCEMMCGTIVILGDHRRDVVDLVKRHYEEGNINEVVLEGIKDQIVPESLDTFKRIVYECLHDEMEKRPTASMVVLRLKEALESQEYDIWKAFRKLIDQMSKPSDINSNKTNEDIYDMLSQGLLLQDGKLWFSLARNGERNELVSATTFSYGNTTLYKWRSIKKSRFQRVVKMMDISNLSIQIKIETQYLSPNVIYGAHLVFKFCEPRKVSSKLMYVNLKYKTGSKKTVIENLHAYFATQGESEWMMIELCQFTPDKMDYFEVLLESLSRYYCGSGAIYIEGIYFRAIDDAILKVFSPSKANGNRCRLPAKMVLYESSDVKCFSWRSLARSRFPDMAELLSHQVFRIKYNINTERLSPNTHYACYLVFRLSERCHGLQCPVKVRDVLLRKNKEFKFLYFRFPSLVNYHGDVRVPKGRKDGLMEVIVWEFNLGDKLSDDCLPMSLKLRCYEGTMSGLIVYGIEIRPICMQL